ncbi:MAG: PAS domain S-box protein [Opitutaceae bacterium]|nr:PAS domain S-box protein [Opitutaceae bacterium]
MFDTAYRKSVLILGLALALVAALIALIVQEDVRDQLGPVFYIIGFAITGCVLLVLAGYIWDRALMKGLKTLQETARQSRVESEATPESAEETAQDEVIGLARKIEHMARNLQKIEASYRGIVEDQVDLICRYRPDGTLTFVNSAYARAFGRKRIELIGQPFPVLDSGRINRDDNLTHEHAFKHEGGRELWLVWTQRAIKDHQGVTLEYQSVGHDFTERKEAEAALRRAKETAEAADRAKSEFFAIISHEIRTPINGIIGFADILSGTELTADQREAVDLIRTSGQTLGALVANILDFSKIESGRAELEHAPFDLHSCVAEGCAFFAPQIRVAGLTLEPVIDPAVPRLMLGDASRLRQILTNLIGNAVKFTPQGTITLHLSCSLSAGSDGRQFARLFFTVSDTGVGIAPETIQRLFLPFSQVDVSPQRRREGTGLGLAISKRLCELMGGGISVESRPGAGSTFRFTVQCEVAPARPA